MQELLGDNDDIVNVREKEVAYLPHFLMLSYLGRKRFLENKGVFSTPSASTVNEHLQMLSGMGMVGLPDFALDSKVGTRSPFVAEGRAIGYVAGDYRPTTKLVIMARRCTFLRYRDGLREQFALLLPGVDSMVRGYLRALLHWAGDWPELAHATTEEASDVDEKSVLPSAAENGLPKSAKKLMSGVKFPNYAIEDLATIIDSGRGEPSGPSRKAALGIAKVLVESLSLAVVQRRLDPSLSILTAYNCIRPHQSKVLAKQLRLSAQDLEQSDQEVSRYYRLVADILTNPARANSPEARDMFERLGAIAPALVALMNLNRREAGAVE